MIISANLVRTRLLGSREALLGFHEPTRNMRKDQPGIVFLGDFQLDLRPVARILYDICGRAVQVAVTQQDRPHYVVGIFIICISVSIQGTEEVTENTWIPYLERIWIPYLDFSHAHRQSAVPRV